MTSLIVFLGLWLAFAILGMLMRAAVPTTVQTTSGDAVSIAIFSCLFAVAATIVIAGIVAIGAGIIGAL